MSKWTYKNIPSLKGKTAVVTGANSGLGFHTTRGLAGNGARVIMACRNMEKGDMAKKQLEEKIPDADLKLMMLDLADLNSVKRFSDQVHDRFESIDLLINNAGLMAIPLNRTKQGFEMQFGVNHLGHFALTGLLFDRLLTAPGPRIVNVSSSAHRMGRIRFHDIHWEKEYRKWKAYGMSKLANLLFSMELADRIKQKNLHILVASSHPGYADTELQSKGARMNGSNLGAGLFDLANRIFAQNAEMGALPSLYAATAGDVQPGTFYGPGGFMHMKGYPEPDEPKSSLMDKQTAVKLWQMSEQLTGITFLED